MSVRALWLCFLIPAAAWAVACAPIQGTIPKRAVLDPTGCTTLRAGAAKVDLTPPPGFPLAGFSISSQMSRGAWTPLQARAIYLQDASCRATVLISTDLMIMPNGLPDRVAEKLSESSLTKHIGRENMLLTATENHLSPGNFFSSKLYNAHSSHVPGFDSALFEFLADRLAAAVTQAASTPKDAVLRTGHAALPDFFLNRAMPAFLRNREAYDFLVQSKNAGSNPCPKLAYADHPLASPERFHELSCLAVTPRVDVIEVLGTDSKPIALAGFLATHTTVLPASVEVFSADLLGITAHRMERGELPAACASDGAFPVVALFNGAQGDVTTQWSTRDRGDILALSNRITEKLCGALPGTVETKPTLSFQYEELDTLVDQSFEDPFDGQKYQQKTPTEEMGGVAELGGAADGRTILYDLYFREEVTSYYRTQHGSKIGPLTLDVSGRRIPIGDWFFRSEPPPKKAPLTVIRIGQTVLVGVPGEMTTMMGARTRHLIAKQAGLDPDRIIVVGFGNGHVSYFPTTEEYDAQWYEGASDFYGPGTGSFLATRLTELAKRVNQPDQEPTRLEARDYRYWAGKRIAFRAGDVGHPAYQVDDGLPGIVQQLDLEASTADPDPDNEIVTNAEELRVPKRDHPTYCFMDALPLLDKLVDSGADADDQDLVCQRNFPKITIHQKDDPAVVVIGGRVQDSGGTEIVTILAAAGEKQGEWCAIWLAPFDSDNVGIPKNLDTQYEFEVLGITQKENGPKFRSPPFTLRNGFDQTNALACSESQDEATLGAVFIERASCTPIERPCADKPRKSSCDNSIDYCVPPES